MVICTGGYDKETILNTLPFFYLLIRRVLFSPWVNFITKCMVLVQVEHIKVCLFVVVFLLV